MVDLLVWSLIGVGSFGLSAVLVFNIDRGARREMREDWRRLKVWLGRD